MWAVIGAVIGSLFGPIGQCLGSEARLHMAYWFCFQRYIRELREETKILKDMRSSIQKRVEIERNNGGVLVDRVEEWLEEVEGKLEAVTQTLEEGQQRQLLWLSVVPRYELGRKAEREKEELSGLKARGARFESGPVAHPALDTDPTKYVPFASRDDVYKRIMEALRDEGDGSYKIGIGGLPGVGKTKMASEVAKQALDAKIFDEVAKATVSQTPDFDKIRQDLADCLDLTWNPERGSIGKARQLDRSLKNGKKILLVLDDVWKEINLMEIGIPDNIKGCKVLITSREGQLWGRMGIRKVFRVEGLSDGEAWELFRKKVGDTVDQREIRGVAEKVCRECGGLPLVILAVGGALLDNEHVPTWNNTLGLLEKSKGYEIDGMVAEVYKPIELSYKYLHPDPQRSNVCDPTEAQSCFLHCCLFAEDAEISIDDLVRYGLGRRFLQDVDTVKEARNRVHSFVDKLKVASLLLQGGRRDTVKMHDVIRDVGISIASKLERNAFLVKTRVHRWQQDRYDCYGTISLRSKAIGELPDEVKHPNLLTLVLASEQLRASDSNVLKVSSDFFKGLEKLEVLDLSRFDFVTLPSSLQNLTTLRMLSLSHCCLVSLSIFSRLHKLEVLCLNHCKVVKPPTNIDCDIVEFAVEAGKLTHLRILDFSNIEGLRVLATDFISNLSCLEELYIYEFDEWKVEGNVSPLELNSLANLSTLEIHLQDVKLLPKDFHFESLNRFKISIGYRFDYTDYEYRSSRSRALKLKGIPLKVEVNTLMERAQTLSVIEINGLEKVFYDKDLPDLEYLRVEQCNDMEHLLGKAKKDSQVSSASFSKLSVLKVFNCKVRYLFCGSTAKQLQQLQKLSVENCEVMEGVIGDRDHEEAMDTIVFNELKSLELKDLPKLKSICAKMKHASSTECNTSTSTTQPLFTAKVSFPALEELNIESLGSKTVILERQLSGVWTEASQAQPSSLNKLRELTVTKNCKWKYLFSPSIARILQSQLRRLQIDGCESMEAIIGDDEEEVTDDIIFHQLESLHLWNLPNLRSISAANTEEMSSTECNPSTITPPLVNAKVSFPALEELIIGRRDWGFRLDSLANCFNNCRSKYLFSPSIARVLQNQLRRLEIGGFESMEAIIGDDEEEVTDNIIFHQLKKLGLKELPNLRSIYAAGTKELSSTECNPSTITPPLVNAKVLFPALATMEIERLDSISVICEKQLLPIGMEDSHAKLCSFSKLSVLTVCRNCKLRYLFSPSVATLLQQQLKQLRIEDCENMEALIGEDEKEIVGDIIFGQLRRLELKALPNLKSISANTRKVTAPTAALPLFNAKVSFPALEELIIGRRDWRFRLDSSANCFSNCKLKYLFSPSSARDLQNQLRQLEIECYESMEAIIGDDEEEVTDDIIFHQLKDLKLWSLPNLRSIYAASTKELSSTECNPSTITPPLVNAKVSFPALETLSICRLDSISVICEKQLLPIGMEDSHAKLCSFSKLSDLSVYGNCKLRYLFSPSVATLLQQQLKQLRVEDCENMEALIGEDEEEIVGDIIFGQLRRLELRALPNLKGISASTKNMTSSTTALPLFDAKVSFPALETLTIWKLDSISVICEKQLLPIGMEDSHAKLCSFSKLSVLTVCRNCKLRYLFSPSVATLLQQQLKQLIVRNCEIMEALIGEDEKEIVGDIIFGQLRRLELKALPNLKSISANTRKVTAPTAALPLFNAKVSFPVLEELIIYISDWRFRLDSSANCFNNCKSKYLFSPSIAQDLQNQLRQLEIGSFESMEAIIGDDEKEVTDNIIFHQLKKLGLKELPNLRSIYAAGTKELSSTECNPSTITPPLVNAKVSFPILEVLSIDSLDSITRFGAIISGQQLQELTVTSCEKIEELIAIESGDKGEQVFDDEIFTFTQLRKIKLDKLPNLQRLFFCVDSETKEKNKIDGHHLHGLFSNKVSFPALESLFIEKIDCIARLELLISFQKLQELTLTSCEKIQEIVAVEIGQRGKDAADDEILVFTQLKKVQLENLPNLRRWLYSSLMQHEKAKSDTTHMQALFDYKVRFPSLETLVIKGLHMITAICEMQLEPNQSGTSQDLLCSFGKLRDLTVSWNCKLEYLFSHSMARFLGQLHQLTVEHCESMEAMIGDDKVEVMDDIIFYELKELTLEYLPNLKSILATTGKKSSTTCNPSTTATTFLGAKVSFPILEVLSIKRLDSMTRFGAIISSQQLQKLTVTLCEKIEELIAIESGDKGEEVFKDEAFTFTQLREIMLDKLPKLERLFFSYDSENKEKHEIDGHHLHGLFTNKVSFPVLKELSICGLKCIMAINRLCLVKNGAKDSFPQLENLYVKNCENMETIVAVEAEAQVGEANENIMVFFPQLNSIRLEDLPNFKSFCSNCAPKNQETLEEALFNFSYNVQVSHLEMLYIKGIDNVKEIWRSTISIDSVSKLTKLTMQNCDKLLNIGPLKLLRNLVHNLEELEIMNCPSLQDGFKIEASNAAGEDERVEKDEGVIANVESSVTFRRLKRLGLSSFDSLLPFSEGKDSFPELETLEVSGESMFEDIWEGRVPEDSFLDRVTVLKLKECSQLVDVPRVLQRFEAVEDLTLTSCSSVQVVFNLQELHATERLATLSGQVKRLTLEELPKLEHIWLMKPKGGLVLFSNLTKLSIKCCNSLRYLFSISIARALTQLKTLGIEKCDVIEEIVMIKNEERGEANVADEIVFPQLWDMRLFTLPELRSFCGANNVFQFPSLGWVDIKGCPKLYTFTCGPTGMRKNGITCSIDGSWRNVGDINEHVRWYAQRMRKLQPDSHRQEQK